MYIYAQYEVILQVKWITDV